MVTKADINIKLQGFAQANRDAQVSITSEATGKRVEGKPFLDGSLTVRDLDPGLYEIEVRHPNLVLPIEKRKIRVFPQPTPTQVHIRVPEVVFKDTAIIDIQDADLSPVQQAAASARTAALEAGTKSPGDAIHAADWNKLAGAVADLARAVGELTQLVSPRGHDHPEIATKIDEVQGNLRSFAEAFGKTVLEIRRQFEVQQLEDRLEQVPDVRNVPGIREKIEKLRDAVLNDTPQYTQQMARIGQDLTQFINEEAVKRGDAGDQFLKDAPVRDLHERAKTYAAAGTQTKAENELLMYQRSGTNARRVGREK
jgi:hypothetical protein